MALRRRDLLTGTLGAFAMLALGPAAFGQELNLGKASAIKVATGKVFSVATNRILVFRSSSTKYFGFEGVCPHDGTAFTSKDIKSSKVTCSKDKSVFSATTGKRLSGPSTKSLTKVPVKVSKGFLLATLATATASPSPTASGELLVEASKVPLGGGVRVSTKAGVLMVVQPSVGTFAAYSAICTHAGCEVSRITSEELICECHGSEFSTLDGAVSRGPARQGLKKFEIFQKDGSLYLK